MALPTADDTPKDFRNQLTYFSSRLSANEDAAVLVPEVTEMKQEIRAAEQREEDAEDNEVHMRAQRDHQDNIGDDEVKKIRNRLKLLSDKHPVIKRLFPKGVRHITGPRGQLQLDRLNTFLDAIDSVLEARMLAREADGEEVTKTLNQAKDTIGDRHTIQTEANDNLGAAILATGRAKDATHLLRVDIVRRLGLLMARLQILIGGSLRDAYAFTRPGKSGGGGGSE